MTKVWPSRMLAFLLWLVVAASATYWVLKIAGLTRARASAGVVAPQPPSASFEDLARLLGPSKAGAVISTAVSLVPAVDPGARMRLLGVVADRRQIGVALISLNGEPPRPYRVGSELDGGYKLTAVATRSATLSPTGQGASPFTLELVPPGATAASDGGSTGSSVRGAAVNTAPAGVNALLSSLRRPGTAQSTEAGPTETPASPPQTEVPENPDLPAKE